MRTLISACIRRPVAVSAFYILIAIMAVVAWTRMPVALLPDLQYPALMVWTSYPNVPPARVERAVTEQVENALAGVEGMKKMTSRTILGGSLTRLDFSWGENLDFAMLNVREQLDKLGNSLPESAERPIVLRINPSERPIMVVSLQESGLTNDADQQNLTGLKLLAREVIARRLEQLNGIARVRVTGGHEREIRILVDADRLASYNLSLPTLSTALEQANRALRGGLIRKGPFQYAIEVSGEFKTTDDIAETIISQQGQVKIRLKDVATVQEQVAERRGLVRLDQHEALLMLVERRPAANTVTAAEDVRVVLDELRADYPEVLLTTVVDESTFIEAAIGGVTQAVWLGGLLAIVILFVFIRRPKTILAVAIAVPLSIGITLILFERLGVTFNLISLSGLALGVGMLVDNAIIVVENIARLREEGLSARDAARQGAAEVALAITASTFTTIAVFGPLTFVDGLAGRLFRDQSLAVVCSLLASLLVALTVVPLMAARDNSKSKKEANDSNDEGDSWLLKSYENGLAFSLKNRALILSLSLIWVMISGWIGWNLTRETVPQTDQGRLTVQVQMPAESNLNLIDHRAQSLSDWSNNIDGVKMILSDVGERDEARLDLNPRPPYEGTLTLVLDSSFSVFDAAEIVQKFPSPADMVITAAPERTSLESLISPDNADLLIDILRPQAASVTGYSPAVIDSLVLQLNRIPSLAEVGRLSAEKVPAYELILQRDVLRRFGVSSRTISEWLEAAARGKKATTLRSINEDIPIVLRTPEVSSIQALLSQRVRTPQGVLLPLNQFVKAEKVLLPASLIRQDQRAVIRLTAQLTPGADLALAEQEIKDVCHQVLPPAVRHQISGANEAFQAGVRAAGWSLLLSLLLVYLILAAQFESLGQPLVILAAVPLAAGGVVLALFITGQTMNLMSLTGCVVLVGIVVNDAIVKVDFINQRRSAGEDLYPAIMQAGRNRVRPILMTTFTTALGLSPLAFGIGQGAELRAPLAIAIVGGLLTATFLTLFVVPVLYTFADKKMVEMAAG